MGKNVNDIMQKCAYRAKFNYDVWTERYAEHYLSIIVVQITQKK